MAHIGVRVPVENKEQLNKIAEISESTISQIVRDSVGVNHR